MAVGCEPPHHMGLPPGTWWLGSKNKSPKRENVETDSVLKSGPRNWQGVASAASR